MILGQFRNKCKKKQLLQLAVCLTLYAPISSSFSATTFKLNNIEDFSKARTAHYPDSEYFQKGFNNSLISTNFDILNSVSTSNSPPTAKDLTRYTNVNNSVNITLQGSDIDNDSLTYSLYTQPSFGTITGTAPHLTYTPNLNFIGTDRFLYFSDDGLANSPYAVVRIEVLPSNTLPVANYQSITSNKNTSVNITLTGDDADGDRLTYHLYTQPSFGVLTGNAPNLIYEPNLNFIGIDRFLFYVDDGHDTSRFAVVSIEVIDTGNENNAPVAEDQSIILDEDSSINISLTASDIDSDALTYSIIQPPQNGVLNGTAPNLIYTPDPNYNGNDSFILVANDGFDDSNAAVIDITVNPLNDLPETNNQSINLDEDTSINIALAATDIDGDALTYVITQQPANGTLTGTTPNLTYTPNPNYNGQDSFTFIANDGTVNSNTSIVSITVNPVNDLPFSDDQTINLDEDTSTNVTLTANDIDGDALTYAITQQPTNGILTGAVPNLIYTPDLDYFGEDNFKFTVNDGVENSNIAIVNLSINPINDAPIATNFNESVPEDSALSLTLIGADIEGDNLTYEIIQQPVNGSIDENLPDLIYIPSLNFSGQDSFEYRVNDGTLNSIPALVNVDVIPVNDAPIALAQDIELNEDEQINIILTATDVDDDTLNYIISEIPENGNLTGIAPNLIYTPDSNFNGVDQFTFYVNDGFISSESVNINLTINPVNDAPQANNQSINLNEDASINIILTASDIDGDVLTYAVTQQPVNGTLTGSAPSLTYTPNLNYNGQDSFSFVANDGLINSDSAIVQINIQPVNDFPVIDITSPTGILIFNKGEPVNFIANANDIEDGNISNQILWTETTNNINLGVGGQIMPTFDEGNFTIKAQVSDINGATAVDNLSIMVVSSDSDGDGIPDFDDECPNSPFGMPVDDVGCPVFTEGDSDADGIPDFLDECPGTPFGVLVDEVGCPFSGDADADGDGIIDEDDECPDTPLGSTVDDEGCAISGPEDADGDGVPDMFDQCPNSPLGAIVNEFGCSEDDGFDSDFDGIPDFVDLCPNTPIGTVVDLLGCPITNISDSDQDGIPDEDDECPNTPSLQVVDTDGCSAAQLIDDDQDGVNNAKDICPNTESGFGVKKDGCSIYQSDLDADGLSDGYDTCPHTPLGEAIDIFGCSSSQLDLEARYSGSTLPATGADVVFSMFDDGYYLSGLPREYTRFDLTETVYDHATGLLWENNFNNGSVKLNWSDAEQYCENLELAGLDDWRLPTFLELNLLIDIDYIKFDAPYLDSNFNIYTPLNYSFSMYQYWTDETVGSNGSANVVDFLDAELDQYNQSSLKAVRCVNGKKLKQSSYLKPDSQSNVVVDLNYNLMWQNEIYNGDKNLSWQEAINYCEALELEGSTDWRLPNINELTTKRDTISGYISSPFHGPNEAFPYYWSSTIDYNLNSESSNSAFTLLTRLGTWGSDTSSINNNRFVRCVRDYSYPTIVLDQPNTIAINLGESVTIDASASFDLDGGNITFEWFKNGSLIDDQQIVVLQPETQGTHIYTLKITDNHTLESSQSIKIKVNNPSNSAPVVTDQTIDIFLDNSFYYNINLPASDADGDNLIYYLVESPKNAKPNSWLYSSGLFRYYPESNSIESDTFKVRVYDGLQYSDIATITLNFIPPEPPVAFNITSEVPADVSSFIPLKYEATTGENWTRFQYDIVTETKFGTITDPAIAGQLPTYTPDSGYIGIDTFTYVVRNRISGAVSNTAEVNIIVGFIENNKAPIAWNKTVNTKTGQSIAIKLHAYDIDHANEELEFTIVDQPANGSIPTANWFIAQNGTLTYKPDNDYIGQDTFTYSVTDGFATAGATITINIDEEGVNSAPNIDSQYYHLFVTFNDSGFYSDKATKNYIDILFNASDPDGDLLSYNLLNQPQLGSIENISDVSFRYRTGLKLGIDEFEFIANDGQINSEPAKFIINLQPYNAGELKADAGDLYFAQVNENVNLSAIGSTRNDAYVVSYEWYLGDQLLGNSPHITIDTLPIGKNTIDLIITDDLGAQSLDTVDVYISHPLVQCPVQNIEDDSGYVRNIPDDDIPWATFYNLGDVNQIELLFNSARAVDSTVNVFMKMPTQTEWDSYSYQQKGLYIINSERRARGLKPFTGVSPEVVDVVTTWSEYVLLDSYFGHYRRPDNASVYDRLNENHTISENGFDAGGETGIRHTGLEQENILSADEFVVISIYTWIYYDKEVYAGEPWGHRLAILAKGLVDNSTTPFDEGLMGFGYAAGEDPWNPKTNAYDVSLDDGSWGASMYRKTIDPKANWDFSNIITVDTSNAQLCEEAQVGILIDESVIDINQVKQVSIQPSNLIMRLDGSEQLNVSVTYTDGSEFDVTSSANYIPSGWDNLNVSINNGVVEPLSVGTSSLQAYVNGIYSNPVTITVGDDLDISNLENTFAENHIDKIPSDAVIGYYDHRAFSLFAGNVIDEFEQPLDDVKINFLNKPEFGTALTDSNGQFSVAAQGGKQTLEFSKEGYLTVQRTVYADGQSWTTVDTVQLLPLDNKTSIISLDGSTQSHQSTIISDAFGSRAATVVFDGITNGTVISPDGSTRALANEFILSATEYETPESMPGVLPETSAFTYCTKLKVEGVDYNETVEFNNNVVMYVDNFLGFAVGEIVPIGYYDMLEANWKASENGVVVTLVDTNNDGVADGVDYTNDGIADDIDGDGETADEAIGTEQLTIGMTYWRGEFNHFTAYDYNWSPNDAVAPNSSAAFDYEDQYHNMCAVTGSYVKPKPLALHEDIEITGTDLTLHYSSQRTKDYHHKITASLSGGDVPASMLEMIARLDIAGKRYEKTFTPAPYQSAEFLWDGLDVNGELVRGPIRGTISVGYKYPMFYSSTGNAATSGEELDSFANAWARLGSNNTFVNGRTELISWSQSGITINAAPESQIAEGWSFSNHHQLSPFGVIYKGDGTVEDISFANNILETGITLSLQEGDDGYYQQDGREIDYELINETGPLGANISFIRDKVTNLEWQYIDDPVGFTAKADAYAYCDSLGSGWRLPTWKEWTYHKDKSGSPQDYQVYAKGKNNFWRSSSFENGNEFSTICVRGEILDVTYTSGLQRDPVKAIVTDSTNGLMWQDAPENETLTYTWSEAINYCEDLTHADYSDWRLPNINEYLYTLPNNIFDHQTQLSAVPANEPYWTPNTPRRKPYWSSTPNVNDDQTAWAIESASYSYDKYDQNAEQYYARCVRNDLLASRSPYVFDDEGKHIQTIDINTGQVITTFEYNEDGLLISMTDQFNNTLYITRNIQGDITKILSPDGYQTYLYYDDDKNLAEVSYADGSDYIFHYESGKALLTRKYDPENNIYNRTYDNLGRIIDTTDQEGGLWTFLSTTEQCLFAGCEPTELSRNYGYTTAEGITHTIEESVLDTEFIQYLISGEDGRLTEKTRALDALTETTLSSGVSTQIDHVIDPKTLQEIPQTITTTLPSGLVNTVAIDKSYGANNADYSQITISTNINGNISTSFEDTEIGIQTTTSAESRVLTRHYNPDNLLLESEEVSGLAPTDYTYDTRGRLTTVTTGTRTTTYNYDDSFAYGNLASIVDAEGQTTSFTYDSLGRLLTTTYPDGRIVEQTYDRLGNITSIKPPGQAAHTFNYNTVGNESIYTPPSVIGASSPQTQYQYDRDRKLTLISRPDNSNIQFIYQPATTLLDKTVTPLGNYDYDYDVHSNLTNITAPTGISNSYSYDGNLQTSETWGGSITGAVSQSYNNDFLVNQQCLNTFDCINYNYDNDNLLTQAGSLTIGRQAQQGGLINSTTLGNISSDTDHNEYGELQNTSASYNSNTLYNVSYIRDRLGRITQQDQTINGINTTTDYIYDTRGRLKDVIQGTNTTTYHYDDNGNRLNITLNGSDQLSQDAHYDNQDRLLSYGDNSYSYNANGDLEEKRTTQTDQPDQITTYDYDVFGNLTQAVINSGEPTQATIHYLIDGQNRRVGKVINGTQVQGFLYSDQLNPIAELDGNNNVVARFIYGTKINVPDYMIKDNQTYRIISDHLGSPRLIVNTQTGDIAQQIDYDEFGNITQDTNPAFQPFGFAGGLYDQHTNLTRFGARDYDAQTGRWTSKDPIRFTAQDSNLYGYVFSDPINEIDPTGKILGSIISKLARLTGSSQAEAKVGGQIGASAVGVIATGVGVKGNLPVSRNIKTAINAVGIAGGLSTVGLGGAIVAGAFVGGVAIGGAPVVVFGGIVIALGGVEVIAGIYNIFELYKSEESANCQ